MKIISQRECQEWLKINLGKVLTWKNVEAEYAYSATYRLPVDTGQKTVFARVVSRNIDATRPGLLWFTEWGVFPSSQNPALFDGYRKSLGENRAIHEAPGHIFDASDLNQIECLFDLALYFYWDAILPEGGGTVAVKASHDEWVSIRAKDRARLAQFESDLDVLEFKRVPTNG
jgi:hypothetical protein